VVTYSIPAFVPELFSLSRYTISPQLLLSLAVVGCLYLFTFPDTQYHPS